MRAADCVATPGKLFRKFEPSELTWARTAACAPRPTAIIAMTHATPMMMPRAVRIDRILLRAIAFMPTLRIVRNFSMASSGLPDFGAVSVGDRAVFHELAVPE